MRFSQPPSYLVILSKRVEAALCHWWIYISLPMIPLSSIVATAIEMLNVILEKKKHTSSGSEPVTQCAAATRQYSYMHNSTILGKFYQ